VRPPVATNVRIVSAVRRLIVFSALTGAVSRVVGQARSEDGTTTYYDATGRVVGKARSNKD
jgi:hypothetical protein